jgi:uncharacterized circularly permuted ATP-grasp superfamily protein
MWLLDNRVQSPSGSGYALENRIVMANVFRNLKNIHRGKLSPYFTEKKRLENLVAVLKIQMVFLSPGAGNETYFEHVYLSSYLGFKLVEGRFTSS